MIVLRDLVLRRGPRIILDQVSTTINPGEKVGLVGRNGAGKSSLFSLFTGRLHADGGDISIPARWRIGEVQQTMPDSTDSATEFVLAGDTRLKAAQARLDAAEKAGDGDAIAHAHLELEEAGAFDANSRAQSLLLGLGFKVAQLNAPVNSFSGGWRMRLQLARALMCPADLLLLDEPTNHLDLDALVWLETWLQRFAGTLLIISHDREFLDAITRVTLHIENTKLTRWSGNYSAFEAMRAERLAQLQVAFTRQQERITQLTRFIDRFRAKATKAKQAQSRIKALERMERLAPVLTESDIEIEFLEPLALPNPMLALRDVDCGYGDIAILHDVSFTVLAGQRIGILGANGQGKSTLVKTITRLLQPLAGQLTEGKGLTIGYFAQHEMDLLAETDTPLQHMLRLSREIRPQAREQEIRNFLGRFRLGSEKMQQSIGTLSGGERARLALAAIVWRRPNLLLLDEPTNHLDLPTREALSVALNEFEGSVLLVSHDRALLREVCDEFWLVADGRMQHFDGDLEDYQRYLIEVSRKLMRERNKSMEAIADRANANPGPGLGEDTVSNPTRSSRKSDKQARAQLVERLRPLRAQIRDIDSQLAALAMEKSKIEEILLSTSLKPEDFAAHGRQLSQIATKTETLEEQWLVLHEQVGQITSEAD
jgi:ATP-binding cassette subfamily F protein 3